uniref:Uncharacterized protein n=1 Tax=Cyprinus carpio carpio TaxID=630221 RepID=A0A9J8DC12_CYPCA
MFVELAREVADRMINSVLILLQQHSTAPAALASTSSLNLESKLGAIKTGALYSKVLIELKDDCFENKYQYDSGFAKKLLLKDKAVPTILCSTTTTQTVSPISKDVGCQTDQPTNTSVGTQLSFRTMRPKCRSKETQTEQFSILSSGDVAIPWTTSHPFTSTPLKDEKPYKRRRFELEEEESVSFEEVCDTQDVTYDPAQSVTSVTEPSKHSMYTSKASHEDTKYIVFENCLFELFETCPVCSRACNIQPRSNGTFLAIDQRCPHCEYFRQWKSQPCVGSTPVGNLQLSASLYFSGASFFQMKKVFESMHLKMFTYRTFRRHASMYLEPLIIYKWKKEQVDLVKDLCEADKVIIGGDMRADSPAKYGSYTTMDLQKNLIIDIQLVQSNEVGGSYDIEKEGLKRSLEWLEECGVRLDCIVTDRHPQIQKFLKERNVTQYYDVWHLEKGLSKKLEQIARDKDCSIVKKWQHSIRNHLYWTAVSSTSGPEKVAKWKSLINHIQDVHIHDDPLYPQCEHSHRVSKGSSKHFKPGSKPLYRVEKVLTNNRVLKDVAKLSPHFQTSSLEAFHSVILRFAPKSVVFPFIGMLCRLYLAGMHFNENSNRPKATTSSGKPMYRLLFPKAKKGLYTIKPVTSNPTYCYVYNLMTLLFEKVLPDPFPYMEELHKITVPDSLCTQYDRPSLEEAIAEHVSRFSQGAV